MIFERHINWVYSIGIIVSVAIPIIMLASLGQNDLLDKMSKETALYHGLRWYLDEAYTGEWTEDNEPNLNALEWIDNSSDWYEATLTIYLDNPTEYPMTVKASNNRGSYAETGGFEITSALYKVAPYSQTPMEIRLRESKLYWHDQSLGVWFDVKPDTAAIAVMTGKPKPEVLYPLAVGLGLILVIGLSWWILWRKRHSYLWLLLCWNFVGIIAVLTLSNRRALLESSHQTGYAGVNEDHGSALQDTKRQFKVGYIFLGVYVLSIALVIALTIAARTPVFLVFALLPVYLGIRKFGEMRKLKSFMWKLEHLE